MWNIVVAILGAALLVFIAVLLIRALRFAPYKDYVQDTENIEIDTERVINSLSELVRCKTVSYRDSSFEDDKEFEKLVSKLPSLYPNVFEKCSFTEISNRALLFKWEGESAETASVMMAHYDVVPADEASWEKPAFEGICEDNILWGRGTLDTKVTMNAILCAADKLISEGFVPSEDVYFAFSGSEEINGNGAELIVDYFKENGIKLSLVIDEGGAVVENVFPGVKRPCGLIGIAEKGMMNVEFSAESKGGHASAPKPGSPLVKLSKACEKIESKPFKYNLSLPARFMFRCLGRHSSFLYRIIFSNLWLFNPVLNLICKKSGGELNALLRTTVAFTQAKGSDAPNVIPTKASLTANIRISPDSSVSKTLRQLKKKVNDKDVNIKVINSIEPSEISFAFGDGWDKISSSVSETWQGCIVSPYLMVQCSDSRHYGKICKYVYRFSAMDLTAEERASIHGNNEKIRFECAAKACEFYLRLLKKC